MKEYDLNQLLEKKELIDEIINKFTKEEILTKQKIEDAEIRGHILKSDNNLRFVQENIKLGFIDWAITGCYYACYHAGLALIQTKGYTSKNHIATLCVMIKEFYKKELLKEEIELFSKLLDYQDILFYVESKQKREDATYSTTAKFDKNEAEKLRIKAMLFVNKIKDIIEEK